MKKIYGNNNSKLFFEKLVWLKKFKIEVIFLSIEEISIYINIYWSIKKIVIKNNNELCFLDTEFFGVQKEDWKYVYNLFKEKIEGKKFESLKKIIEKNRILNIDYQEVILNKYIEACFLMWSLRSYYDVPLNKVNNLLYFTFFSDYVYERKARDSLKFDFSSCYINHSELECLYCNAESILWWVNNKPFFDLPTWWWAEEIWNEEFFVTNLTKYDTIAKGGMYKIEEILENLDYEKYDIITINQTCTPSIIWDELKSMIAKYQQKTQIPIVYKDQNAFDSYKEVETLINSFWNLKEEENTIVYIWNSDNSFFDEAKNIFEKFNLKFKGSILPNISKKAIRNYLISEYKIFFESDLNDGFKEIFEKTSEKVYYTEHPYWLEKSINFYFSLISKMEEIKFKEFYNIFQEEIENFEDYKDTAKDIWIWFVITPNKVEDFFSSIRGINILSMLKEMWFKLYVMFYSEDINLSSYIDKKMDENNLKKSFYFYFASGKEELDFFLGNKYIDLYYSEILDDDRLINRDKNQFSFVDISPWIRGSINTIKKLVKLWNISKNFRKLYY